MSKVSVFHPSRKIYGTIRLPGSKSESNRALILQALSGQRFHIHNLAEARDTQLLKDGLTTTAETINVQDAGTAMRFLTAYFAATNQRKVITGSERMRQRPIGPLVEALKTLGFRINYLAEPGFPPLEIVPLDSWQHIGQRVDIAGHISSQFISALLLIAPYLPQGLTLHFTSPLTSAPYVEMTLSLLQYFGVNNTWQEQTITVAPATPEYRDYTVGADWSAASYWYSMAFLADEAELTLEGLQNNWLQGDRITADWMKRYGIATEFNQQGALIRNIHQSYPQVMKLNYADNPDLAQTFAAMFAARDVAATFSGLDSLRIKETDRVLALRQELYKCGYRFDFSEEYQFYQLRGKFQSPVQPIRTYNDHRMAMSFAPLALLSPLVIEQPEVVAKSYPAFWGDLEKVGFDLTID